MDLDARKPAFPRLGIQVLDDDHRDFLLLMAQIKQREGNLARIKAAFMDYATQHFRREEAFLRKEGYSLEAMDHHARDHGRLSRIFHQELIMDTQITIQRLEHLREDFLNHIQTFDTAAADWIAGRAAQ